ncbi:MAG TPA: hypothetical protein VIO85_09825 [Candidatus Dormibacteraeota bacterium]
MLWLGSRPLPESLRSRAVAVPVDSSALDGWLAVRRLGDELTGGRSVKQALEFDGVSLWWFVHHWLVYGKGLTGWDERYRVLRRVMAGLQTAPTRLVLTSRRADDDLVVRAVAAQNGIGYSWDAPYWVKLRERFLLRWRAQALMGARLAKLLLRGLLARLMRKNSLAGRGHIDLLFYTSSSTWNAVKGTDRLFTPLLEEAKRRGLNVAGLHLDYRPNLGLDTLSSLDRRIVAWESLVTPARAWRAMARGRAIERALGSEFPGQVHGMPASRLLTDRSAALRSRLSDAVLAIETARHAIAVLRPRSVYVVDAYDLWAQALVVAAREAGVPSVEIQHGIIQANHSGYLHLDGEIAADRSQLSPYSPTPDVIAVFGEGAKKALVEDGHFPADAIQVTGSPNIQAARQRQDERSEIRSKLGLRKDAFTVLYFGAPHHIFPADIEHLRAFLAACRSLPEVAPLLRPHPADQGPRRYQAEAAAAGVDAPVLTQADPFELIVASDVVIAFNSTTALDAMALERAVIHINMSGSPDLFRFVEDGGALRATDPEELRAAIAELSSPDARLRVVRKHAAYISQYYAQCANPAHEMLEIGFPSAVPT